MPIMALMFHLPVKVAVVASLVSVIATSNAGGSSYVDQRITNLRLGLFFEIATTIGAVSGTVLALYLHEWLMLIIFALLLAYMSYTAFRTRKIDDAWIAAGDFARQARSVAKFLDLRDNYHDEAVEQTLDYAVTRVPLGAF